MIYNRILQKSAVSSPKSGFNGAYRISSFKIKGKSSRQKYLYDIFCGYNAY
ncbi:hypothetical protein acsn021_29830 [Anaerocolumna cellulosilytica]|uniref:Uncharacterized protein n=1 Tax=Anaerocolumna cellulosilytica TaxID=433286 RepID=A0A6S6QXN9_9FIRM|nr:hypothetical protein acsn021_29830 [Anaerocolumna cellulosilytica]